MSLVKEEVIIEAPSHVSLEMIQEYVEKGLNLFHRRLHCKEELKEFISHMEVCPSCQYDLFSIRLCSTVTDPRYETVHDPWDVCNPEMARQPGH